MMQNSTEPLVSIVTVCYNAEGTIEQTIRSVINQTYPKIEYIIIDGKSTDNTLEIINYYRSAISQVVSERDDGIYDAMNKGIGLAHGDFIGIINADDWYEEKAVEQVVNIWKNEGNEAEVITGQINFFENQEYLYSSHKKPMEIIWEEMPISHPSTFIQKKIYDKFGRYNTEYKIAADYDFVFRLYINGVKFCISDEKFSNFRVGGISTTKKKMLLMEDEEIIKKNMLACPNMPMVIKALENKMKQRYIYEANRKDLLTALDMGIDYTNQDIYIFGCGYWGRELLRIFDINSVLVKGIIDNNHFYWGKKIGNNEITSPDILIGTKGKVIIAMWKHAEEVIEQLQNLNRNMQWITLEKYIEKIMKNVRNAV